LIKIVFFFKIATFNTFNTSLQDVFLVIY